MTVALGQLCPSRHRNEAPPPRRLVRQCSQTPSSCKPSSGSTELALRPQHSLGMVRPQSVVVPSAQARALRNRRKSGARALEVRPQASQDVQLLRSLALGINLHDTAGSSR